MRDGGIGLTILLVTRVGVGASNQRESAPARYLIAPEIKSGISEQFRTESITLAR